MTHDPVSMRGCCGTRGRPCELKGSQETHGVRPSGADGPASWIGSLRSERACCLECAVVKRKDCTYASLVSVLLPSSGRAGSCIPATPPTSSDRKCLCRTAGGRDRESSATAPRIPMAAGFNLTLGYRVSRCSRSRPSSSGSVAGTRRDPRTRARAACGAGRQRCRTRANVPCGVLVTPRRDAGPCSRSARRRGRRPGSVRLGNARSQVASAGELDAGPGEGGVEVVAAVHEHGAGLDPLADGVRGVLVAGPDRWR